jgi:hypothetical protein
LWTIVQAGKSRARELDHVHFEALPSQAIEQRADQGSGIVRAIKSPVEQVHSHQPDGFLLVDREAIEHLDVDDDLRRLRARLRLESYAEPSVAGSRPAGTV